MLWPLAVVLGALALSACSGDGADPAPDADIVREQLTEVRRDLDALAVSGGRPAEVIGCGDSQDQPVAYRAWGPGESKQTAAAVADGLVRQGWTRVEEPDVVGYTFERRLSSGLQHASVSVLGETAVTVSLPGRDAC